MPFALLMDFVILLFHDGRPVRLRVISTFVVALCVGILTHLWGDTAYIAWEFPMVAELWKTGIARESGGLIAGGFTNAIPGIILQLFLVPLVVRLLQKARVM